MNIYKSVSIEDIDPSYFNLNYRRAESQVKLSYG